MKHYFIFLSIVALVITGCNENVSHSGINRHDTLSVNNKGKENSSLIENEKLEIIKEDKEDMVDISRFFSLEELDVIRDNYVKQLRYKFCCKELSEDLSIIPTEDWNGRNVKSLSLKISDNDKISNMDAFYRIIIKKYPIFKPVSQELFEEKMKDVFGINIKDTSKCSSLFYTNHRMDEESYYSTYIDIKNHLISFGDLPLSFKEEVNWDEFYKKLENIDRESVAYYDAKEKLYEEYLSEALQKKYTMYCSKIELEYLFHFNNYVFYDSQASLSWMLANYEKTRQSFTSILFKFYNYDKEPRINRTRLDYDISKGFPLCPNNYEHIFGEVESCSQTDYYNHFKFKVRTGLMQYVVDNCYDDTDLDDCGLKKDKYICVMEDCFDYLFKKVMEGDKYKESEQCHYYQTCAYLAYYLQKAYDNYVSHDNNQPRCWHNALANNLYDDIRNNESRFENYVKENNYFNLDGFEEIMKDAHDQAMRE